MGVLGLWRLLDPTGKPVPLETLEGKVLAIDVSIWIHQVLQGYQDRRGNSLPNAHLIGLFNRICKLIYFKIKPVFVFDGGVPLLKKNTIATRRKLKSIAASKAQKLKNDLINNLIKHTAVKGVLDKGNGEGESIATQFKDSAIAGCSKEDDIYKLPDIPTISQLQESDDYIDSDNESQMELSPRKQSKWMGNIHTVDINNEEFKNLPADVRYDILTDLKETRKQNSWGRMHELPSGSNKYSGFQVNRLLKRRYVQESLEVAEKEMGGKTLTLEELDKLLTDQGINTTQEDKVFRIASDSTTRVIYLKDKPVVQNNEDSNDSTKLVKQDPNLNDGISDSMSINSDSSSTIINNIEEYDLDEDSCLDEDLTENSLNDSELLPKSVIPKSVMNPALAYMLEHSGLTKEQVLKIVEQSKKNKKKSDSNSSYSSSIKGRRTPRRLSLQAQIKKKKLFDSSIIESPKLEKEILTESTIKGNEELSSGSDDFIDVLDTSNALEKNNSYKDPDKTITMESSDCESDDFIEIQDVPIPEIVSKEKKESKGFEILINANEDLQDDIFADVFTNFNTVKKEVLNKKPEPAFNILEKISFETGFHNNPINEQKGHTIKEDKKEDERDTFPLCKNNENNQNLPFLLSENLKPDNREKSLPTTSEEIVWIKKTDDSVNLEKSESSFSNKEVIIEKNKQDEHIETTNNESNIKSIEDSVVDEISINSEGISKECVVDELITSESPNTSSKTILEIDKEPSLVLPTDEKELELMKKQLENEQNEISGSLGKLERQATDITDQMRLEAQELLRLFGIPYLVAPMEAEAQCAYLEQIKLTDGTVTDDSDIWLFGGQCVYKHFFDNNKRVLQFLSNDIEHHLKLSRKEMIQLALLVGSDYTNGLVGVGPVTALEILAAFPSEGEDILRGLRTFCTWFRAGKLAAPGKITLRNKLKNIQIEKGFPSQAVVQSYMCPMVDESKETFTWAKPNLVLLADYVKKKFGWTKLKFEEIINPVMKKLSETKSQKGIDTYFKVCTVPKSIEASLSKRVQNAVQKLSGSSKSIESCETEVSTSTTKKKVKKVRKAIAKGEEISKDDVTESLTNQNVDKEEGTIEILNKKDVKLDDISIINKPKQIIIDVPEVIPQREKDKANALKTKLKAIEIFRKSRRGLNNVRKTKKVIKKIKKEADLSESSSSSS